MEQLTVDAELIEAARDLFQYPEPESMQEKMSNLVQLMQWASSREIPGAARIINDIKKDLIDWEELQIDYTRLFINSFPQAKAHPFAGWYLGDTNLFGDQELEMRNLYAAHNVYLDEENVPADHIMVELEFTALLLDSYDKTEDSKLRLALREWIDNHMSKWIPAFTEEIRLNADSDFYRTTAEILRSLLFEMQNDMEGVA